MSEQTFSVIGLGNSNVALLEQIAEDPIPKVEYRTQTLAQLVIEVESLKNTNLIIFFSNEATFISDTFTQSAQLLSNYGTQVVALIFQENDTCELTKINGCDLILSLPVSAKGNAANFVTDVIDTLIAPCITESIIMLPFDELSAMVSNSGNGYFSIGTSNDDFDRADIATTMAIDHIKPQIMDAKKVLVCIAGKIELDDFITVGNLVKAFVSDDAVVYITTSGNQTTDNNIKVSMICA